MIRGAVTAVVILKLRFNQSAYLVATTARVTHFPTRPGYTSQYHKPGSVENPDKNAAPKLKLFSSVDQVY